MFVGADTEQLRGFASSIESLIAQVSTIQRIVTTGAEALDWVGDDATSFRSSVSTSLASTFGTAVERLTDAVNLLRSNAAAQDQVSANLDASSAALAPLVAATIVAGGAARLRDFSLGNRAAWWASLSQAERDAFIRDHADIVGNLDGIPFVDRYEANRLRLEQYIADLRAGGAPVDRIAHFERLAAQGSQILMFDAERGLIAQSFGNLDTAKNVAVVIPGIGNDLNNFDGGYAANIRSAAGDDTATIQWLGYDTPSGPLGGGNVLTDPAAISAARAKEWAPELAGFTNNLGAQVNGQVSVVAHSYGTVLATEAAKVGMQVDKVILAGSPGVPADNASVFNGASVYAVRNVGDAVTTGSAHGTDPTANSFGATTLKSNNMPYGDVLKAGLVGIVAGPSGVAAATTGAAAAAITDQHTNYFDIGSTSLDSIAGAITGPPSSGGW